MHRRLVIACLLVVLTLAPARAQAPKVGPDQRYVFISYDNVSRLQSALDVAGALGFDVLFATGGGGVLLGRTAAAPQAYKVVVADRAPALETALNPFTHLM